MGAQAPKSRAPEHSGAGAIAMPSLAEATTTLVLINLPGASEAMSLEELASRGVALASDPIRVVSPDPVPAFDMTEATDENADAPVTAGDPAVRSQLFGRYTGQINSRIDRAWLRPRTPVSMEDAAASLPGVMVNGSVMQVDGDFRCAVKITQDRRGYVREVELVSCNGTHAWRQSLINAIQQASPLPAPPSPTVFTNVITLTFEARAYEQGAAESEYESATYRSAQEAELIPYKTGPQVVQKSIGGSDAAFNPGLPFDAPIEPQGETLF